jgi:hypothetical protein
VSKDETGGVVLSRNCGTWAGLGGTSIRRRYGSGTQMEVGCLPGCDG